MGEGRGDGDGEGRGEGRGDGLGEGRGDGRGEGAGVGESGTIWDPEEVTCPPGMLSLKKDGSSTFLEVSSAIEFTVTSSAVVVPGKVRLVTA